MSASLVAGIFVGGRARRMGGLAKGLLVAPSGEPIVTRLAHIFATLGVDVVLVGEHPAYAAQGIAHVADDPRAEGPLAGLLALLEHAKGGAAIAIACDMPHVTERLVARLVGAPPANVIAARRDGRWEPFFARYDANATLPIARDRAAQRAFALQGLLAACDASELVLDGAERAALRDWDTPDDVEHASV